MTTLAFSTNAYTGFTLPEACDRIAEAGYRAVEVLADVPHAYPPTYDDHRARRLRERLEALGLACVAINANTAMGWFDPVPAELTFEPSLVSPDPRRRSARVEIIDKTPDDAPGDLQDRNQQLMRHYGIATDPRTVRTLLVALACARARERGERPPWETRTPPFVPFRVDFNTLGFPRFDTLEQFHAWVKEARASEHWRGDDYVLDSKVSNAGVEIVYPSFGYRIEHTGSVTLRQWLEDNAIPWPPEG